MHTLSIKLLVEMGVGPNRKFALEQIHHAVGEDREGYISKPQWDIKAYHKGTLKPLTTKYLLNIA